MLVTLRRLVEEGREETRSSMALKGGELCNEGNQLSPATRDPMLAFCTPYPLTGGIAHERFSAEMFVPDAVARKESEG